MALTPRATAGLEYAAKVGGVTVAVYSEQVLEAKGIEWAGQADAALKLKRAEAFDAADSKATKEQIIAAASAAVAPEKK